MCSDIGGFFAISLESDLKPEINLPQGRLPPPAAGMWGVPQMPPHSSLLKAGHVARGVRCLPTVLVFLHPLMLWSEAEAG